MLYIIDGYNLLFRFLDKGEKIQKTRDLMIAELSRKTLLSNLKVILVFDSNYQPGGQTEHREGELVVVYTNEGETADEWILKHIKETLQKADTCVVSSDHKLTKQVRLKGSQTMPCEEFVGYLNKRIKTHLRSLKKDKAKQTLPQTLPTKKKVLRGSLEYYEELFEKELAANPVKKISKEKEKKSKIPKTEREVRSSESDMDRWSRLFGA